MTRISLIVATDRHGVIGRDGALPWHLPDDLRRFKALTMGRPIVMGRRTWDSIGRALPGRRNIVVSRQRGLALPDVIVAGSLGEALAAAGDVDEVCVIGGAEIYRLALPLADTVHLTLVDADVGGDTVFPALDASEWDRSDVERHAADARHAHAFEYVTLRRRMPAST